MKTTKKVSLLVWNFNRARNAEKQCFINEYFHGIESILDGLYKEGWIFGYKKYLENETLEIFLKYDVKKKPLMIHVKNTCKPSLQPYIRIQELVADCKNTANLGIIRTATYGFLTNRSALKNKTGGIYLAKFY